jgi:adenine-specific DNA-methyltransferase
MKKQRLELTWIGKDERPRLEPRILLEDAEKSYHAAIRSDGDIFDNRLIFGDNLLALKALEEEFLGKLKCIYIDPPYNTGGDFFYYEDGLEHSRWLSMMRDRLTIMWGLLAENGSIWISIDDNEIHYLKVIMDEIFGRTNFVATVIWQKNFSPKSTARHLSASHDYILVYVKNIDLWERNLLPRGEDSNKGYRNPDHDPRGVWTSGDLSARNFYGAGTYPITAANGRVIPGPPRGMYWRFSKDRFLELDKDNRIWWGKDGNNQPRLKRFLSEVRDGVVPQTIWLHTEVGNTQESKKEIIDLIPDAQEVFQTAKPERLIRRILELATNPGDLVLDSFAGSGTTGAVAHKMGRRWIMVELGEHCQTHIIPRLKKVIDGEDKGGITEAVDWQGGGGFRYYRLAPSLLEKDRFGNWIIAKQYNAAMLAEAVCKLMGFTYQPSQEPENYWQHGHSTENDFIYVTTQSLTHDALKKLADEVGPERTLLVCCKAFSAREAAFPNLTIKKIPHTVLSKCEWGRDDYSLSVSNLPAAETIKPHAVEGEDPPAEAAQKPRGRKRKVASNEPSLFSDVEGK